MKRARAIAVLIGVVISSASVPVYAQSQETPPASTAYVPKIGDLMGQTQLRHFKLWFAGSLGNWELANYEVGQIWDSFDTAAKLYPQLGDVPFAQLIKGQSAPPLAEIGKAIAAKNSKDFDQAFAQLTTACNACHVAARVGFIKIRVPTSSPFSNELFPPERK